MFVPSKYSKINNSKSAIVIELSPFIKSHNSKSGQTFFVQESLLKAICYAILLQIAIIRTACDPLEAWAPECCLMMIPWYHPISRMNFSNIAKISQYIAETYVHFHTDEQELVAMAIQS